MIACQMTTDLFEYSMRDLIEGPLLGVAVTCIGTVTRSDLDPFIRLRCSQCSVEEVEAR
jgi:peroxiredoxin family protein